MKFDRNSKPENECLHKGIKDSRYDLRDTSYQHPEMRRVGNPQPGPLKLQRPVACCHCLHASLAESYACRTNPRLRGLGAHLPQECDLLQEPEEHALMACSKNFIILFVIRGDYSNTAKHDY